MYLILIGALTVWTFLYELEFKSQIAFFSVYIVLSLSFLVLMLLTKGQLFTRTVSVLMLFPVFFLMLFNFSRPVIFLPPLIVGIIMFFACSAGDNVKVIMGSLYLLMFVVGSVGYVIVSTLFGGSAIETRLDSSVTDQSVTSEYDMEKIERLNQNSVSPDGKYRYYILDVQDNDRGKVIIAVEPNDCDINYKFFTLTEAGYTSRIAKYSVRGVTPDIEWVLNDEYDGTVHTDAGGNEISVAKYKLRYRFGEGSEWKTSTVNLPKSKNYLRFLNVH